MSEHIIEILEPLGEVGQVSAGAVIYPPKGRYGPRLQTDYQLVLLDSGEMTVTINEEDRIIMPPGHVTLLVPGHIEYFTFSDHQETHHRWISTTMTSKDELTLPSLEKLLSQRPIFLPISEEINKLVDIIFNLQRDGINANSSAIRSLGWAATMLYLEEGRKLQKRDNAHPSLRRVKSYIRESFFEPLSLRNLAEVGNVSEDHLIRLFKKHEGITPIQYLWKYRIRCSLELLQHTGFSINEIANQTGFKNPQHFSRMIRQYTGVTPTQMRQEKWSQIDSRL